MNAAIVMRTLPRGALLAVCIPALCLPVLAAGAARGSPPAGARATQSLPSIPGMPAKLRAILEKASQGEQISPAEQKMIEDWEVSQAAKYQQEAQGGGGGASPVGGAKGKTPASGMIGFESSASPQSPCVPAGHAAGLDATPSRAAYLAMAHSALQTYGRLLSSDTRSKLTQALHHQKSTAGSDLAPLLMVTGETDAAIYSAAYAAVHAPTDVLTANNLGAMLRAPPDYARSAVALKYAASLAPKSSLVATNLGWLALSQGDHATAGVYLKTAVAENPHMAGALAAQGVIQMCSGHASKALPLFRASMAAGYSQLAAQGINAAVESVADQHRGSQPDINSPDVYGPKSGLAPPTWPAPPMPEDVRTMASSSMVNAYVQYQTMISKDVAQNQATINAAYAAEDDGPQTRYDGHELVFDRGYDKEIFVLGDLQTMLGGELQKPIDALEAVGDRFVHYGGHCLSCAGGGPEPKPSCTFQQEAIAAYPQYVTQARGDWQELMKATGELYSFSAPWIARIHDPAIAAAEKRRLDNYTMGYFLNFSQLLELAAMDFGTRWQYHIPDSCEGDPGAMPAKPQPIKPYPINPLKCQMKPMVLPLGLSSMKGDCERITMQLGAGPFAFSGQYKFAPDYTLENGTYVYTGGNDGEWTLFAGAKLGVPSLPGTGISAGPTVSFQGGHVTDIGLQAGASAFGSPVANARVGAMSGISSEPDPDSWSSSGGP